MPNRRSRTVDCFGKCSAVFEPERGGSCPGRAKECIVAHTEQWYLKYGEEAWRNGVMKHVDESFEAYNL